jgi:NADH:ubiquinone oxidoreductase subunit E
MVTVKICRGTVCHVMGGSDLPLLPDLISDKLKPHVRFEGTNCLGTCIKEDGLKPPFVQVNTTVISEATFAKVIKCIETEINLE